MTNTTSTPRRWRKNRKLTMAGIASMLGIGGKNPSRTWQRYETGEREPPISVIAKLEMISEGAVTTSAWMHVRQNYQARQVAP